MKECSNCIHKNICNHKTKMDILVGVIRVAVEDANGPDNHTYSVDINCKDWHEEKGTIRTTF